MTSEYELWRQRWHGTLTPEQFDAARRELELLVRHTMIPKSPLHLHERGDSASKWGDATPAPKIHGGASAAGRVAASADAAKDGGRDL